MSNLNARPELDAEPLPDPVFDGGGFVRFFEHEAHDYLRRLAERSGRPAPEFPEPRPGMIVRMISKQAFAAMIGIHPVSLMRRIAKQRARRAAATAGAREACDAAAS